MTAPNGYRKLPDGVRCRCMNMWSEPDGSLWCCQATGGTGMKVYVTDSEPDPQVIMMLADKDERIAELEAALGNARADFDSAIFETGNLRSGVTKAMNMEWTGNVCPDAAS